MTVATLKRSERQVGQTGIRGILYDLVVDPFEPSSVVKYQDDALKPYEWRKKFRASVRNILNALIVTFLVGGFMLEISSLFLAAILRSATGTVPVTLVDLMILVPFVSTVGIMISIVIERTCSKIGFAEWNIVDLADCKDPIPEFVLQTVQEIKERNQGEHDMPKYYCRFMVHTLSLNCEPIDPFLVVETNEERLYIEVWNESYQKNREVSCHRIKVWQQILR